MLRQTSLISPFVDWGIHKSPEVLTDLEKGEIIDKMEKDLQSCKSCPLHKYRKPRDILALKRGTPKSKIMLVGKAPGYYEVKSGTLFNGPSLDELKKLLSGSGLNMDDVYITNACNCRLSEDSSNPTATEIKTCFKWLHKQIEIIRPKIIVMMGAVAIYSVMKRKIPLNVIRGKQHGMQLSDKDIEKYEMFRSNKKDAPPEHRPIDLTLGNIKLIATFHPAFYLRSTIEVEERNHEEGLKDWVLVKNIYDSMREQNGE